MSQHEAGTYQDLIEHRFRIAQEDLDAAYLLLSVEQYRGANNRACYSIYHTIDVILSIDKVAFKRHKDTLAYFNQHYVATEVFSRDMGKRIVKAEEIRHASDYDTFYVASKDITKQQIETAEQLLKSAQEYYHEKKRSNI